MSFRDPLKQKAAQAAWYQTTVKGRRAEWLAKNGPCRKCGSSEKLEVDHVDPSQKVTHQVWTWAQERRDAELAKCQVLCSKCHRKKTIAENRASETSIVGINLRKTECPKGHPYDLLNTITRSNGWRDCRTCHNDNRTLNRRNRAIENTLLLNEIMKAKK
ncbi:MAG: HNH endonuclease signature motif containing protein [Pseudomonadota bacterium]